MSDTAHTTSIRPGRGPVVRLIAVMAPLLAAAVAACSSATGPSACVPLPPFDLQGTWHGAAPHVTLTVTLGRQQFVAVNNGFGFCGGSIDAGSYADSTIGMQGEFVPGGQYSLFPDATDSQWAVSMGGNPNTGAGVVFNGIASNTTTNRISGTVFFQNADATRFDTVAITMVKQ
jgi:hypothetical protein